MDPPVPSSLPTYAIHWVSSQYHSRLVVLGVIIVICVSNTWLTLFPIISNGWTPAQSKSHRLDAASLCSRAEYSNGFSQNDNQHHKLLEWNATPILQTARSMSEQNASTSMAISLQQGIFPTTIFTNHIQHLIESIDYEKMGESPWKFTLIVPQPFHPPSKLICQGKKQERLVPWWCTILEHLFLPWGQSSQSPLDLLSASTGKVGSGEEGTLASIRDPNALFWLGPRGSGGVPTILPTNVSFAVSSDDYLRSKKKNLSNKLSSLSNSDAARGTLSTTNFLELQRMADQTTYPIYPWNDRCPIPVWRGSVWWFDKITDDVSEYAKLVPAANQTSVMSQVLVHCPRCRAVYFSRLNPALLDAKIGDDRNGFLNTAWNKQYRQWWEANATNGLNQLLPIQRIRSENYYSRFQSALVLCGLGAAFRTPIHLSTVTAVILQDCPYKEWYQSLPNFEPWKQYIPLDAKLDNLEEVLVWIRDNPSKVEKIAQAGRQFYQEYLSFQRNYEHFYEFIYRLALSQTSKESSATTIAP